MVNNTGLLVEIRRGSLSLNLLRAIFISGSFGECCRSRGSSAW